MTEKTKKRIRFIYGIVLSVSIVFTGLCLIISCLDIYRSGDQPYSRETVAEHFEAIAAPVYLCLVLVIGGFILDPVIPAESKKRPRSKQSFLILKCLHEKTDMSVCDETLRNAVAAEQRKRMQHNQNLKWLLSFCTVCCLSHILTTDRFQLPDINGSMISAMRVLVYWLVVPFVYAVFAAYYSRQSIQREINLLKNAPAEAKRSAPTPAEAPSKGHTAAVRLVIILAAAALLLYGYFTGGTNDVLTKAVNICTECVGLG